MINKPVKYIINFTPIQMKTTICHFLFNWHLINSWRFYKEGIPSGSDDKESAFNSEEPGSILGSGRSPGEGNGYPLQYSCLKNPMDRGAFRVTVHGVTHD